MAEQDPDIPPPNAVTHWLTYNIPSSVTQLDPGQTAAETLPNGAMQGLNSRRTLGYLGACPPVGSSPHHYTFQLFALDGTLPLQAGATIVDVQRAMTGHIVGQTQLVALFGR
jgi:Raf kinase inhibitor-like YbhB/YbcL family protein